MKLTDQQIAGMTRQQLIDLVRAQEEMLDFGAIDFRARIVFDRDEGEWHLYAFGAAPGRYALLAPGEEDEFIVIRAAAATDTDFEAWTMGVEPPLTPTNLSDALEAIHAWVKP